MTTPAVGCEAYVLEEQVGFILRQVSQRHAALFLEHMIEELTPTQFAALAKLHELGPCSQNRLGRLTAMDAATVKGVIDRLGSRGFVETRADPEDARRRTVLLTPAGRAVTERALPVASRITAATLSGLDEAERIELLGLLKRMR